MGTMSNLDITAPPIVGLTGYAGSGKDTVGDLLVDLGYHRRAFADPIRDALYALDPYTLDRDNNPVRITQLVDAYGWDRAKQNPDVRRLLQRMGTEAGRDIHGPRVWIDRVFAGSHWLTYNGERLVITDVRFTNEAFAIRMNGGQVWRVERAGVTPANDHDSEKPISDDLIARVIHNDGTIDDLARTVHLALADKQATA